MVSLLMIVAGIALIAIGVKTHPADVWKAIIGG